MKKPGIVGGIGPESTIDYYRGIIGAVREARGDDNNPQILINSINITGMLALVADGKTEELVGLLSGAAGTLADAGADFVVLASNTPHLVFEAVQERVGVPMLSIVDATCRAARQQGLSKLLLLGTMFTMRAAFYSDRLAEFGIEMVRPEEADLQMVQDIIFPNLVAGVVDPEQKAAMIGMVERYVGEANIDGVILGCTELPYILKPGDVRAELLDTSKIHVEAIVQYMLQD